MQLHLFSSEIYFIWNLVLCICIHLRFGQVLELQIDDGDGVLLMMSDVVTQRQDNPKDWKSLLTKRSPAQRPILHTNFKDGNHNFFLNTWYLLPFNAHSFSWNFNFSIKFYSRGLIIRISWLKVFKWIVKKNRSLEMTVK